MVAQTVKKLPAMRETWVWSLDWEDPLNKEMATHSSIFAWRIPWTEEPGSLQSTGSQRVRHDWVTNIQDKEYMEYGDDKGPIILFIARWPTIDLLTCCGETGDGQHQILGPGARIMWLSPTLHSEPWDLPPECWLFCRAEGKREAVLGWTFASSPLASPLHPQQLKSLKSRVIKISSKFHQLCLLATVKCINILERHKDRGCFLSAVCPAHRMPSVCYCLQSTAQGSLNSLLPPALLSPDLCPVASFLHSSGLRVFVVSGVGWLCSAHYRTWMLVLSTSLSPSLSLLSSLSLFPFRFWSLTFAHIYIKISK